MDENALAQSIAHALYILSTPEPPVPPTIAPEPVLWQSYPAERPLTQPQTRLVSLDVLRGLTVAGMILVTDPGTYSAVYPPLLHAAWNGATPTDLIFPDFLFSSGVAIVFSFRSRLGTGEAAKGVLMRILRRFVLLMLLGLVVNGFPFYHWSTLRLPGILQRIALCYSAAAFLYLWLLRSVGPRRGALRRVGLIAGLAGSILTGYALLLRYFRVPGFGPARYDSLGYLGAYIDRAVFTIPHLWPYGLTPGHGVTYDSEGLLSTLPAVCNTLIGLLAGEWLLTQRSPRSKVLGLLIAGLLCATLGWLLHPWIPVNKRIWTSSFALLSSGCSLFALGVFYWLADVRRSRWWTAPALIFGTNAILAFVLSSVLTTLLNLVHVRFGGEIVNLHRAGYQALFLPWLAPRNASLAYAIAIVLLNMALLLPLYRRRLFLRV